MRTVFSDNCGYINVINDNNNDDEDDDVKSIYH